eukprot:798522_1
MSTILNIPHIIIKEIAAYAKGEVQYCSNAKCHEPICVFKDIDMGYKCCVSGSQIFCIDCVELTIPALEMSTHLGYGCGCDDGDTELEEDQYFCDGSNCCRRLQFIPECHQCDVCHQPLPMQCACSQNSNYSQCYICDKTVCSNCRKTDDDLCICCGKTICTDCIKGNDIIEVYQCYAKSKSICIDCFDDTVIECGECNVSCPLLYKTNTRLRDKSDNYKLKMEKCKHCDSFACLECNKRTAYCHLDGDRCMGKSVLCGQHRPQTRCWRHQDFEKQPEVTYERGMQILVKEGRRIDVYDSKVQQWRSAKYYGDGRYYDRTKRIMILYTETDDDQNRNDRQCEKFGMLQFPSVSVWRKSLHE